jgi:hypothetical protein
MTAKKTGEERGQKSMFDLEEVELAEITDKDREKIAKREIDRKDRRQWRRLPDGTMEAFTAPERVRFTSQVQYELAEHIRDALYWLGGHPEMYTLTRLATEALEEKVASLAKKYAGKPFVRDGEFIPRVSELRTGRPLKYGGKPRRKRSGGRKD